MGFAICLLKQQNYARVKLKYGLQFVTKFKLRVLRHWFGFLVAEVGTAAEFGHKNGWAPHWSWSWVFWPSSQSMALAAVLAPHWRCSKRFTLCLDLQAKVWLWRTFAQLRGEIRFKMKCNLLPSTNQKRKKIVTFYYTVTVKWWFLEFP